MNSGQFAAAHCSHERLKLFHCDCDTVTACSSVQLLWVEAAEKGEEVSSVFVNCHSCCLFSSVAGLWASLGVATLRIIAPNSDSTEGGYNKAALCCRLRECECVCLCVCMHCFALISLSQYSLSSVSLQCTFILVIPAGPVSFCSLSIFHACRFNSCSCNSLFL